ncbi:MAG: pyridoxal-phosphate dependent enzyme [Planctomycetota bacterium]|nr:pyridoxal-phosphate dependent enzyme [Planctomycetota bacterium]
MQPAYACTVAEIEESRERIAGHVHRTPVITCQALDQMAGRQLFFKCENLQKVGAFKFRGATNAVLMLTDEQAANGVVTHSSGNHAQAVALAAKSRGIDAHIVMPSSAPAIKRAAVEGYGARVISCQPTLAARESTADEVIAQTGASFIHPYNDSRVIAGQGTCALEFLEQAPGLDAIITPVGGGGLVSGVSIACRALAPQVRVLAAEPAGADDAARSMEAGRLIPQEAPSTVADGLLTSLGDLTWPIIRDHVERIVRVDEAAIIAAMELFWQRAKLVIEPSSATALAPLLDDSLASLDAERVGVILSGGNVDLEKLPWQDGNGA